MALDIKNLTRVFVIEKSKKRLDDPNPDMTPDQVMNYYSVQYPELTTATVHGPEMDTESVIYKFKTTVGTKG